MLSVIKAYKHDWNPSTSEGYSEEKNEVYMVFNCDIRMNKTDNVIQYVVGRIVWISSNFPLNSKIIISFDFRGQEIIISGARSFKDKILKMLDKINIVNNISIDFLI